MLSTWMCWHGEGLLLRLQGGWGMAPPEAAPAQGGWGMAPELLVFV
jgi:hypothetical protein